MPFKKGELPLSAVAKRQLTQRIKEFKGLSREQRKELLKETWQEVDLAGHAEDFAHVGGRVCFVGLVQAGMGPMGTMDAGLFEPDTATQNRSGHGHSATPRRDRTGVDVLQGVEAAIVKTAFVARLTDKRRTG